MKQKLYAIRDSKGEAYGPPFIQKTHGEAERTFQELSNDGKSQIAKYPEDFDLYYLGVWDDNAGKIETLDTPMHIVKAINTIRKQQQLGELAAVQ